MVWYSHLLKNFPQFVVIHTVKGFSVVNEADIDVFLEFPCFIYDLTDVLYLVVCICQTQCSNSSNRFSPPWCPYVCSLHLCVYF